MENSSAFFGKKGRKALMINKNNTVAKPFQLKVSNRKLILNVLKKGGAFSIADISSATGISRQTVTKAIEHFIAAKIVVSLGKGDSTDSGGKKPALFSLTSGLKFIVILTRVQYFTISLYSLASEAAIAATERIRIPIHGNFDDFLGLIRSEISNLMTDRKIAEEVIYGISLIVPGVVENNQVLRFNPFNQNWGQDIPIAEKMNGLFKKAKVIFIDNISRVAGIGTILNSADRFDYSRVVTLYTFEGIAGCLFHRGELISSSSPIIGEFGHMLIDPDSPVMCNCGRHGCFEALVSPKSIRSRIQSESDLGSFLTFAGKPLDEILFCDIVSGSDHGFACCIKELARLASYFARVFYNIAVVYDPDIFIIEGYYACYNRLFEDAVRDQLSNSIIIPPSRYYRLESDATPLEELELSGSIYKLKEHFFSDDTIYS